MEGLSRGRSNVISLSQGVPFYFSDDIIRDFVVDRIRHNKVDKYSDPQGILELREKISANLREEQMNYSPEEVLISSGATEALSASLLALTNPTDEIIIPTPTYSAFFRIANLARLSIKQIKMDEENGWTIDIDQVRKAITKKTKVILLCNPNNPTGTVYSESLLIEICELAVKHNFSVVLDETYHQMIFDGTQFCTPARIEKYKKHIIRIVSFSKDFAITGWRVGYLVSDTRNIHKIVPVHDSLINCAPVVSQYAALKGLEIQDKLTKKNNKILLRHREVMVSYLLDLREYLDFSIPQASYFFFPKLKRQLDDVTFCMNLFERKHVALVPGSDFGNGGKGHVRICFGRELVNIHKGMLGFSEFLQNT